MRAPCQTIAAVLVATAAACGDGDPGNGDPSSTSGSVSEPPPAGMTQPGASVGTQWQLHTSTSQRFHSHVIDGADGEHGNTVLCGASGSTLTIDLTDAGMLLDYNGDGILDVPARNPSVLHIRASLDDSPRCAVHVQEAALDTDSPEEKTYEDTCTASGGTCELTLDESRSTFDQPGANVLIGTLRCADLRQPSETIAPPLVLAAPLAEGGRDQPLSFELHGCF